MYVCQYHSLTSFQLIEVKVYFNLFASITTQKNMIQCVSWKPGWKTYTQSILHLTNLIYLLNMFSKCECIFTLCAFAHVILSSWNIPSLTSHLLNICSSLKSCSNVNCSLWSLALSNNSRWNLSILSQYFHSILFMPTIKN